MFRFFQVSSRDSRFTAKRYLCKISIRGFLYLDLPDRTATRVMKDKSAPIKIELFYTLTCPNCGPLKRMLTEILPEFGDKFVFKTTLASAPIGMLRSMKLGIHSVPTLLINDKIVFRELPSREDLINKLKII